MEPVPSSEYTPLVAHRNSNNNRVHDEPVTRNNKYREELSLTTRLTNCFASLFTCGGYGRKHQEAFEDAVNRQELDLARVHYGNGATIHLGSKAVVDAICKEKSNNLQAFLVANATADNHLQTFQTLCTQKQYLIAEIMAETAPIKIRDRITIFNWALSQEDTNIVNIAKQILGPSAKTTVTIVQAVFNETLHTLIPTLAKTLKKCPYTHLTTQSQQTVTWENGNFVIYSRPWDVEIWDSTEWGTTLLFEAIWAGNTSLVKDHLDRLNRDEIPPLELMLDAVKNKAVDESTRNQMTELLTKHLNTAWYPHG